MAIRAVVGTGVVTGESETESERERERQGVAKRERREGGDSA